ncbi:fumarylacetoacetase [Adelges cooleyi]|uniref:fumarylacetoacetase n=1 Tax=Adelges cooleyi TaxID=133065 RepID=UPI00218014A1|nr:fumarylacetoacetase [Adelges cooleyi]
MPLQSYIPYTQESHFPIENLPYGVFSTQNDSTHRIGVAIGEKILDLKSTNNIFDHTLSEIFQQPSLHSLMASSKYTWAQARKSIQSYLSIENADNIKNGVFWNQNEVTMHLPVSIGDYTDYFSCYYHAINCGNIMMPQRPLAENWKHMPIAYHGRSSSVIISGTPVTRPKGQFLKNGQLHFGPTEMLDYELEMAFFVGGTLNSLGDPIQTTKASDYIFGMVMLNDWSARDIQLRESTPLGPFLSKNFSTSISPWVVTMEALNHFKVDNFKQDFVPMQYLRHDEKYNFNIHLNASVCSKGSQNISSICDTNYKYLYWTPLQQIAHHTINGCNLQPGDLLSSGTISGPKDEQCGCLFERTRGGERTINLVDRELKFFNDGDEVILSGYCQGDGYKIGFGTCSGKIIPAIS